MAAYPTDQQLEVLNWIAHGYTTTETAAGLQLTEPTVRKYLSAAAKRLGANSRAHAVLLAERAGLIGPTAPGGPMLTYLTGDATQPIGNGPQIIAHVCNDVGVWGAGFVLALSKRWPKPEAQYRMWHRHRGEFPFDLGRIQLVNVEPGLVVANMIAQRGVGSSDGVPPIRYDAVETCLYKVAKAAADADASVHMPRIGCGLAGGRWEDIEPIVKRTLCANGVRVYVYDLP